MSGSIIAHYRRGGQGFDHDWVMSLQVIATTIGISIAVFIVAFYAWVYATFDPTYLNLYKAQQKAAVYRLLGHGEKRVDVPAPHGRSMKIRSDQIKRYLYIKKMEESFATSLMNCVWSALSIAALSMFLVALFFYFKGRKQLKAQYLSGDKLSTPKKIAAHLRKTGKASSINIDDLPLVRDSETQHIGVIGTTGTGKSVLIKKLLNYAERQQQKAVVYDKTGEFTALYYNPDRGDIILNPFDIRMPDWSLWDDFTSEPHFASLAESLIPSGGQDPFWALSARHLFATTIKEYGQKCQNEGVIPTVGGLSQLLLGTSSSTEKGATKPLRELLKNSKASNLLVGEEKGVYASIISMITTYTKGLTHIGHNSSGTFSIRNWLAQDRGWLFLTSRQDIHAETQPLISAWFNNVITQLMSLRPDKDRRLWLFLDELPSLNRIPVLSAGLAEGRKFGACFVLGFQSIAQLNHVYGQANSQNIASLLNTRFYFRQGERAMADWASQNLGETTQLESIENRSYGANTVRDGVSINRQEKVRRVATASDMMKLPDLSCFVRLAGDISICKHVLKIEQKDEIAVPYICSSAGDTWHQPMKVQKAAPVKTPKKHPSSSEVKANIEKNSPYSIEA